ncbi:peptidoglycan-binding protein [Streptomyces sp. TRM76323]|uniref:Peptidoglycan-binding protein n=1 Tax=Streptomyces tamarix TaxID=3078565 RepID=A0ABU3QEQ6_9ACTN|nr:peptidoglycan-binding protein [Streptomyces tamarix]MDT9681228.1 peptidoglycan-binding protein [Streptomyces tamarix]
MPVPVFEEYEPAADCPCPGCARRRRELALRRAVREGGHPAAHGARRALVLFTAAGVVLGGAPAAGGAAHPAGPLHPPGPAGRATGGPGTDTPQGGTTGLHGRPLAGPAAGSLAVPLPAITRTEIINRAKRWVTAKVPYSMEKYWTDGYRQDCSGYVSMAWKLPANEWTGSLHRYGVKIARADLQPGDILLFHNPADPTKGSHVTIFGGWTDPRRTHYVAYEQTKPHTRRQATPLAYWTNSDKYVAYRYLGVTANGTTTDGAPPSTAFPGARYFGPGAVNAYVTRLGRMLAERGGARFYERGPGPRWSEADRRATAAFQRAQGWRHTEADGLPGPHTWRLLTTGRGRDIPPAAGQEPPPYPGRAHFRPGQSNKHVETLGRQLVRRGYGKHYRTGPDPLWSEADRRNVQDFQRAQGWRGGAANGYPGPETWRRLFR